MKKFFFTLAFICSLFTLTAMANDADVKVSAKVMNAFHVQFSEAQSVEWAKVKNLFQAKFSMEDQQYAAYFDEDGALLVVARFMEPAKLPFGLRTSLQQLAQGAVIEYVFELSDDEGVHYYATLQKGEKKEILRSSGSKKWMPYNKVKI